MSNRSGLTLVELLTVMAIIGILVGISIPAIQSVRESARRSVCQNNLRQLAIAALNYESAHGFFPIGQPFGFVASSPSVGSWTENSSMQGHLSYLFEYLELTAFANLTAEINTGGDPWYSNEDLFAATSVSLPIFRCPTDQMGNKRNTLVSRKSFGIQDMVGVIQRSSSGWTNYLGSAGSLPNGQINQGIFFENSSIGYQHITDGSSHTLLMGEVLGGSKSNATGIEARHSIFQNGMSAAFGFFQVPELSEDSLPVLSNFTSLHSGGVNFSWADGHVKYIDSQVGTEVMYAVSTRSGAEITEF